MAETTWARRRAWRYGSSVRGGPWLSSFWVLGPIKEYT